MNQMDEEKQSSPSADTAEVEPLTPVDQATVPSAQWEELKAKAAKADENWDRLVRTTADFDNYRKRATREKQDSIRYANEALLEKLMPVLDAFDKAVTTTEAPGAEGLQSFHTGVSMIYQQLKTVLTDAGLEEVDASGKDFDPNLHEAVSQVPTTEVPEGRVVRQLRKGYRLRERLLRPATVIVATQPASK